MFVSFDGIDGAGKSTQIARLAEWLRSRGRSVVLCRDPGTTALGEVIRELLLGDHEHRRDCRAEMFLYMAARAQLVDEVIVPALVEGQDVVVDRFLLANVVYQGHAGHLAPETIWKIGETATGGKAPDVTFVLDLPVEEMVRRMDRPLDRMERRGTEFLERVRQGYLTEARQRPEQIVVIDATQPVETVGEVVTSLAEKMLSASTS